MSIEQIEETSDFIRIIYWPVFIISQLVITAPNIGSKIFTKK